MTATRWVCFDVNGTTLDPGSLARAWGPDEATMRPRMFEALQDAVHATQVDTTWGLFPPMKPLLQHALERQARLAGTDPGLAADAVALVTQMDPYPDMRDALERLIAAGLTPAAVTNSALAVAREGLEHAGLIGFFADVISVEAVGRYKPHPDVYAHALQHLGATAADTWFVAGHWWDVTGAKRAGMRTAWVAREEVVLLGAAEPNDVDAADMHEAATGIIAAS